jgi:hypothetical protein
MSINSIQNMSAQQCDKFQKLTDQNKRAGHKTPALAALVATLEPAAPAAPARPAPAAVMPTAASIAKAMLDEQERRAAASLVKSRADFTAMTPRQQSDFCRNGGRIV